MSNLLLYTATMVYESASMLRYTQIACLVSTRILLLS